MSLISAILSALWQAFLGMFGVSDARKLGRAEVQNTDLKAALKEKTDEAKAMERPDKPFPAVVELFKERAE